MSNILDTARQLNAIKADFEMVLKLNLPEPLHLNRLLKKLNAAEAEHNDEKIEGIAELWKTVLSAFKAGRVITMALRDKKKFPFLLGLAANRNSQLYGLLLEEIKSVNSAILLKREIFVYFNEYSNIKHITDLRVDIVKKLRAYKKNDTFLLCMKRNSFIFNPTSIDFVQKKCISEGVFEYFDSLHFSRSLMYSNYVTQVIKGLFGMSNTTVSLKGKLDLFTKIYGRLENAFVELLPIIFASLITQIEAHNGSEREHYKEIIRPKALAFMGDPRLGIGYFGRWSIAGEKATDIFITWLSQYDLDAFFKVIGDSLTDYTARNMWMYRERFWKSYKKQIQMVWVCFGSNAIFTAKRSKMSCGKYSGFGDDTKSCILIVIGDYMFVERSHNGTLKVWKKKLSPFKIGESSISESKLNKTQGIYHLEDGNPKDGWRHDGSEKYRWQTKVGSFIHQYMHIYKTINDWRI